MDAYIPSFSLLRVFSIPCICRDRMFVCHSTATVARQCDVGLDKVSHQQYGQAGGCRVGVIQRRGDDGPRRCCSRQPASRILYYTAVRDPRDSAGSPARARKEAPRQPRQGGCTPSREQLFMMELHAMCLFLALLSKGTDVVVPFCSLQVGGSFLVLRVHLCS